MTKKQAIKTATQSKAPGKIHCSGLCVGILPLKGELEGVFGKNNNSNSNKNPSKMKHLNNHKTSKNNSIQQFYSSKNFKAMRKISTILTVLAIMFAMSASAKVWRVSNRVINGLTVNADFTTLQSAINGASPGDTIYMMGSPSSYGSGSFSKKLVVIGPGYWLEENDSTQAVQNHARVTNLSFNAGSQGTMVSGLYIYYGNYGSANNWKMVYINTDSITLQKNYIFGYANDTYKTYPGYTIYVNGNRDNISIQQNWIEARIHDTKSPAYNCGSCYDGTIHGIYFNGKPSNSKVINNVIRTYKSHNKGSFRSIVMSENDTTTDLNIYNNIFWGNMTTYWTNQLNNIFVSGSKSGGGDLMMHNIGSSTQYPIEPPELNNLQNVSMDSVFVDHTLYIDKGYILGEGSQAIGAGANGGDCGVFGYQSGGIPYVLSGLPAIPAIYATEVESTGANSVSVTIKAKSHNEHK